MEHKAARPSGCKFTRLLNYNLLELVVVRLADLIHGTIHAQVDFLDPYGTLANALNLLHGVRNEQDRDVAALDKVLNTVLALLLEKTSPTESVSSTIKISGSVIVAIAKAVLNLKVLGNKLLKDKLVFFRYRSYRERPV